MSKTCQQCGNDVPDEFAFCGACGSRVTALAPDGTLVVKRPANPLAGQPELRIPAPSAEKDATLVVQMAAPAPTATAGAPAPVPARPAVTPVPYDTGIDPNTDAIAATTISAYETRLFERPYPNARVVAIVRRGEAVEILRYDAGHAAVRLRSGQTGHVQISALSEAPGTPAAPTVASAPVQIATTGYIRNAPTALRPRPTLLADGDRRLPVGEPVQLRELHAHFAAVTTSDGAHGYVERANLAMSPAAARRATSVQHPLFPNGPSSWITIGAAALVFIGALLPWFRECPYEFCASESGVSGGAGWVALLLALLGGGATVGSRAFPTVDEHYFPYASSVCGGLVVLTCIIAMSTSDGDARFGVFFTIIAGSALAVAPWTDRIRTQLSGGQR